MNIKSIITTLAIVTATSTAAIAKPVRVDFEAQATVSYGTPTAPVVRDHRYDGPVVREHRYDYNRYNDGRYNDHRPMIITRPWRRPEPQPQLVISQPQVNLVGNWSKYIGPIGTVSPRSGFSILSQPTRIETIRVGFDLSASGAIGAVKFQAAQGTTSIKTLGIVYGNGEQEFINVNQTIDMRNPMTFSIDLKGRSRTVTLINVYGTSSAGSAFQLLAAS
ncbi:MAG: hypothetical protein H0T79_22585 [Deltaproteobacteria bacterium]|nr:hypothetical protein [Deltaproteobacteria bacterium]